MSVPSTSPIPPLYPILYEPVVRRALAEDLGRAGDLTTDAVVPAEARGEARIVARAAGRVAGLAPALATFRILEPGLELEALSADGRDAEAGEPLAVVRGPLRPILSAERTALNLLGRLSGVATATHGIVRALAGTGTRVVCTRKTMPGLAAPTTASASTTRC
jgi:nicotinate-nucleotide pyrophosphorylase (carboxylating)